MPPFFGRAAAVADRYLPLVLPLVNNHRMLRKSAKMTILIADDDPDDRMFLEEALQKNGYEHIIEFVEDGEELMTRLRQTSQPMPNLLMLDLNMPRKNGFQALQEIKADPRLRRLPVVVMTTSSADEDVARSYDLGVNSFITKPFNFNRLIEMIGALKTYWLDTVKLPD